MRLFAMIHKDFTLNLPLSAILYHSTVQALAAVIDENRIQDSVLRK